MVCMIITGGKNMNKKKQSKDPKNLSDAELLEIIRNRKPVVKNITIDFYR